MRNGEVSIAYQVVGDAPIDILMIPGWISHLAMDWEEPTWLRWCDRMTSFARLIRFDKRGTGLTDRPPGVPTLEERMGDARAVMDAVGIDRAHVLGWSEGGPLGVLLAVTYPERVQSLTLYGTQSCFRRTADYQWGMEPHMLEERLSVIEKEWGQMAFAQRFAPHGDDRFARQWAAYQRAGASPSAAAALGKANSEIDVRPLLPAIRVPTLVLSRRGDPIGPPEAGRYMADRIPGSRFVELVGDHVMWLGDVESLCGEIEEFITGLRPGAREPGSVMTILQCDVEGSTTLARELGDERWADLLARYGRITDLAVTAQGGRIVDRTGDGLMATFSGPVAAIRAAQRLQREAIDLGIRVRAGIHIGDVRQEDGALRGIAVHVAARVMAEARGGEIFLTETVKDIVAGARLRFEDRGVHKLKGMEGLRRLFAVT
ncbi:MAG: adenylate/guanylate cyclase domain-containing protein [Candidatus Rokuibacteriota bacterium]